MTLCGFIVTAPDRAFAWADLEVYVDGDPVELRPKLTANLGAGAVLVGAGSLLTMRAARSAFHDTVDMDEAADLVGTWARRATLRPDHTPATRSMSRVTSFGIAGFSTRFGRIVGYELHGVNFLPAVSSRYATPRPAAFSGVTVDSIGDVLALLPEQLAMLRAGGLRVALPYVNVVEIRPDRIITSPTIDLDTGRALERPPVRAVESALDLPSLPIAAAP